MADNQSLLLQSLTLFGREEATRTPDPYVPNVVRYQLRYFPNNMRIFAFAGAKVRIIFELRATFADFF